MRNEKRSVSEVDFGPSGRDSNSNRLIRSHNLPSYVFDLRILIPALFRQIKHFYHFEPNSHNSPDGDDRMKIV